MANARPSILDDGGEGASVLVPEGQLCPSTGCRTQGIRIVYFILSDYLYVTYDYLGAEDHDLALLLR